MRIIRRRIPKASDADKKIYCYTIVYYCILNKMYKTRDKTKDKKVKLGFVNYRKTFKIK